MRQQRFSKTLAGIIAAVTYNKWLLRKLKVQPAIYSE